MLKTWLRKPIGGGPAPLLHNPVERLTRILLYLHISLLILSAFTAGFPFVHDLRCSALTSSLINALISAVMSAIMALYYGIVRNRSWGTEAEWGITVIVTSSLSLIDLGASIWGIYVLFISSVRIYQAYMQPDLHKIEAECFYIKAAIFYASSFAVILLHVIVSVVCLIVSLILSKRVTKSLQEIKSLV